jgi:hypothetical protein
MRFPFAIHERGNRIVDRQFLGHFIHPIREPTSWLKQCRVLPGPNSTPRNKTVNSGTFEQNLPKTLDRLVYRARPLAANPCQERF